MTTTDENSSSIIPFFPYVMEDCVVSKITENEIKKIVINPTKISDSGASVGRITAIVDNGNGRVIFRPNGECKVILKISSSTHDGLQFTSITNGKRFDIDVVIPLKSSIANIASVTCTAGMHVNTTGSVTMTGSGYNLYDNSNEHHVKVHGLLNVTGIDDQTLKDKLCITVIIDYM